MGSLRIGIQGKIVYRRKINEALGRIHRPAWTNASTTQPPLQRRRRQRRRRRRRRRRRQRRRHQRLHRSRCNPSAAPTWRTDRGTRRCLCTDLRRGRTCTCPASRRVIKSNAVKAQEEKKEAGDPTLSHPPTHVLVTAPARATPNQLRDIDIRLSVALLFSRAHLL